jgi:hypothetical protein
MKRSSMTLAFFVLAGCYIETFSDKGNPIPDWEITTESAGPIRIGMHADSALAAMGETAANRTRATCDYLTLDAPIRVMVERDTVVRFDVMDSTVATAEGARVGDPITRIEQLYSGRVRIQPHKYTAGKYLIVTPGPDTTLQLIFETDSARVTRYRGGRLPQVAYVEGCG